MGTIKIANVQSVLFPTDRRADVRTVAKPTDLFVPALPAQELTMASDATVTTAKSDQALRMICPSNDRHIL